MRRALLLSASFALAAPAAASVTEVTVDSVTPAPAAAAAGGVAYEIVRGTFAGELDPADAHNRIVTDLAAARRNARGRVEYRATFAIARPVDPAKGSGLLYYDVPNRGNGGVSADPDGHVRVVSGWQGDLPAAKGIQYAVVPAANGVTGLALARFVDVPAGTQSLPITAGLTRQPRPLPLSLDTAKARLTREDRPGATPVVIAPDAWAFADCSATPFPGKPDGTKLCLRDGFGAGAYTLTYTAKDPLVLGIGFAATRDLVAYLRSGAPDAAGHPNPAGTGIRWTVASGTSQSGNFLRSFVHLGFNADEHGKRVFDGINPNIAARQVPLNVRFGVPGGAAGTYEPGSEGMLWWGRYRDRARGLPMGSLLDRCTASGTCPKVVETFGSAEFWGLRMSPDLVGTDARADIALPANVRRYYSPAVTHSGGRGPGFSLKGEGNAPGCVLPGNPNHSIETLRVAQHALVAWVTKGQEPPASRYPTLAKGDLVEPTAKAMGWPAIPGAPQPDVALNPFLWQDFGPGFRAADLSGVATRQPPRIRATLPARVPRVDADGNETSGIRSVYLQVPVGSYLGWNVQAKGYAAGTGCGFAGGFIPFRRSKADRLAAGDPRLSLEERYGDRAGFLKRVAEVVAQEQAAGWLLPDDAARILREAEASDVLATGS